MNNFEKLNDWVRDTESSIVNLISAIAPWLAPLAPAFMTYQHTRNTLNFPVWIALPGAVTVEILGFSTVSTFLAFWFHNRKKQAEARRAPIGLVIFAFVFYLTLILVSNVLLDTFDNAKWAVITVRGLFTLQSIPAALIVAVRTQHRDLLSVIEKEKADKKNTGHLSGQLSGGSGQNSDNNQTDAIVTDWRKAKKQLSGHQIAAIAKMSTSDIVAAYGVEDRTARRWRKSAQEEESQPFP